MSICILVSSLFVLSRRSWSVLLFDVCFLLSMLIRLCCVWLGCCDGCCSDCLCVL